MGQWRHSGALSPSRSRNFCSPGPRYSMIGSSNRPTLPLPSLPLYVPPSSGTRLIRNILERSSSCIHRYRAPAVISRRIIYSKSSMRVAGQVRMMILPLLFFYFVFFFCCFPSSGYLTDLFAELIISFSLFLCWEIHFCGFFLFFEECWWSEELLLLCLFVYYIFSSEVIYCLN